MSTIDWDETFASTNGNPDLMASVFNSVILALLEVHAPLKRIKITSHHALWITVDLKNLMKKHDLAKKNLRKTLPIVQGRRNYETKLLMSFVKEYRNITTA